jgi:translation initiation factor IF-1
LKYPSSVLLICSIILASCANYKRPYTKPTSNKLMDVVSNNPINLVRNKGKVDAMLPGGRLKVKVFLIADKHGRLRFDAVIPPPMNSSVLLLTSDGSSFRANDQRNNKFYTGKADTCAIKSIMGIPLHPKLLYRIMLGLPPEGLSTKDLTWDSDNGHEIIKAVKGKTRVKIHILGYKGKKHWKVVKLYLEDGSKKIKVEYRGHKKILGKWVPTRIRITKKGKNEDTVFFWSSIEPNVEMSPAAFGQNIPPNMEIRRLICPD